jgi:arylsulfatase A
MIPKVLKSAGYVSTCVGKWGQLPLGPAEFGFDDYLRFFKSGVYWNKGEKKMKYVENGVEKTLNDNEYMPDVMHNHLVDFIVANKEKPFFAYYPMSHVHAEIVATPDSKPDSKDLFADNISYMDKLVGKLVRTLDSLKLREKTMIVFMGDNGTSSEWVKNSTVNGKALSGKKGEMKECGGLVPMIVNWPTVVAPGVSSNQLIDASDFVPTLAALTGATMPKNINYDGQSFAAQLTGSKGTERDWIFVELGKHWYVRDSLWKLNEEGQLFDMSNAPFEEKLITPESSTSTSETERKKLQAVLDQLSPQTGIVDTGTGDGRHANKKNKKEKAGGEKAKEEGE